MGLTKASFAMITNDPINVQDYGAVGDGTTDDTAAIQAAIDAASAYHGTVFFPSLPAGQSYKTTAKLNVTKGVELVGEGWQPITDWDGSTYTRGAGSWIYVSEPTESAIHVYKDTDRVSGVLIKGLAFVYDQPTPGTGWTATDSDYCIKFTTAGDSKLENVMMLNPGKGLEITGATDATSGRVDVDSLFGQPMYTGIHVDFTADVCRLNNIHFWPFWSEQADVMAFTRQNAWFMISRRNDNMQGVNWFGYAMNGIRLTSGTMGVTSRIKLTNIEFDSTKRGFWVPGIGAGSTGQITNFSVVAPPDLAASDLFISQADGVEFEFSNVRLTNSQDSSVRISGNNARYKFSNIWCEDWNLSAGGFPAIYADANTHVYVVSPTFTDTAVSGAAQYGGTGEIIASQNYKVFTGTLNGSGKAVIATHGIFNLAARISGTAAFFNNTTTWNPLNTVYVDNTNAEFVSPGGAADSGKAYRVLIQYIA